MTSEERSSFQKFLDLLEVLSSSAGAVIGMGNMFQEEHEEVVLHTIEPKVTEVLREAPVLHRIHMAYSMLLYFTSLVSNHVMCCAIEDLPYCKVLTCNINDTNEPVEPVEP